MFPPERATGRVASWPWYAAAAVLILGCVLRTAWPLADPPEFLSWSSGVYTDGPAIVAAARNDVIGRDQQVNDSERHVYPLLHTMAQVAFQAWGPSRRTTELLAAGLGLGAVVLLAAAVRRAGGRTASLVALSLGATSWWIGSYSRILLAESVSTFVLMISCWCAVSRRRRELAAAGALAAAAGLFGKFHALAFLPALLAFVAARGGVRALGVTVGGVAAAAAAWVVLLWNPHRAEILDAIAGSSVAAQQGWPIARFPDALLEPFRLLRDAWLFHRMPIVAGVAVAAAFATCTSRDVLRRRVADGSALFVFALVTLFAYHVVLPYRAPRYFHPIAFLLVAVASCELGRILDGREVPRLSSFAAAATSFVIAFGLLDALRHVEAGIRHHFFAWDWAAAGAGATDLAVVYDVIEPLGRHLLLAAGAGALLFFALRRRALLVGPRSALVALVLSLSMDAFQWTWWIAHRTTTIESAKESFREILGADAVVLGAFAPMLSMDSDVAAVPQFRRWADVESLGGATHVIVAGATEQRAIEARFPRLAGRMVPVQRFSIRAAWSRELVLLRLPNEAGRYRPSPFERAVDRVRAQDWSGALAALGQGVGRERLQQERRVLEATCRFQLGQVDSAEALLRDAVRARPFDPILRSNLSQIALARGDTLGASAQLREGIRIDPLDPDLRRAVRRSARFQ